MIIYVLSYIVDDIKSKMDKVSTFYAEIEQITYLQGSSTTYKGFVYIKKPSFFRWELYEPERYIVIASGDSSWVYYNGEIMSQPVPYKLSDFLSGKYEGFKVKERKIRGGWRLKLTPEEAYGFDSIIVTVSKDYLPRRITIFNFSDYIDINFKKIKLNEKLPDSLFVRPR